MICVQSGAILDLHYKFRTIAFGGDGIPNSFLPDEIGCLGNFPDLMISQQGNARLTEPDTTHMVVKLDEGSDAGFTSTDEADFERCDEVVGSDWKAQTWLIAEMVLF